MSKPNGERSRRTLGQWLRELRQGRGLPLRAVAAAAEMDSTLLSKIELGQRLPTEAQTRDLAAFFRLAFADLEARRLADRFLMAHRENPLLPRAARLIKEAVAGYRVGGPEKAP